MTQERQRYTSYVARRVGHAFVSQMTVSLVMITSALFLLDKLV